MLKNGTKSPDFFFRPRRGRFLSSLLFFHLGQFSLQRTHSIDQILCCLVLPGELLFMLCDLRFDLVNRVSHIPSGILCSFLSWGPRTPTVCYTGNGTLILMGKLQRPNLGWALANTVHHVSNNVLGSSNPL